MPRLLLLFFIAGGVSLIIAAEAAPSSLPATLAPATPATTETLTPTAPPPAQTAQTAQAYDEVDDAELGVWQESFLTARRTRLAENKMLVAAAQKQLVEDTQTLARQVHPLEAEVRRLLALAGTYRHLPNYLDIIKLRLEPLNAQMQNALAVVADNHDDAKDLLDRVRRAAAAIPDELRQNAAPAEGQSYRTDLTRTQNELTWLVARYEAVLAPYQATLTRGQEESAAIAAALPKLWTDYYLHSVVNYWSADTWKAVKNPLDRLVKNLQLRRTTEIPDTAEKWHGAWLRFALYFLLAGVVVSLLGRHFLAGGAAASARRHLFRQTLTWFCLWFAFFGAAHTAFGESYRLFLAAGNLALVVGLFLLGRDLRALSRPAAPAAHLWRFAPLAIAAYALFYLPLSQPLVWALWSLVLVLSWLWRRAPRGETPALEGVLHRCETCLWWACLLLSFGGLPRYSMVLYLLSLSLALMLQISWGLLAKVGDTQRRLAQADWLSALKSVGFALATPMLLVAVAAAALFWIVTLPGGWEVLKYGGVREVSIGSARLNAMQAMFILSAFYIARTMSSVVARVLPKMPENGWKIDPTLIPAMQTTIVYLLWFGFTLFALRSLGISLANIAIVAGGFSVGIGFGMQTIVNNFVSGLILIFSRTLVEGDVVEVGGTAGVVRQISVRATQIETFDNALIYVPNAEFVSGRLVNWTRNGSKVRKEIAVGIAYGADIHAAMKLMTDVAKAHVGVIKYPAPAAYFVDFADSTLNLLLRFWVDYNAGTSTASELRLGIEAAFRENNIDVAFPQIDVHIKNEGKEQLTIKNSKLT
ncbi:mechanosensitive ion channel protein [Planctomycetales bacterium]|nr:mechanosensitive ion channel protein [Planctomycetales bacterium]GHS97275.1 mechanosensitive ion channel protein [Planctomycetales bacterium]GHT05745.1 mechanosensitive ion channel protein [Planctomycetales bacterium]